MPGIKRKESQSQPAGQSPPKKFKKEDADKKVKVRKEDGAQYKIKKDYDAKKAKNYTDAQSGNGKQSVVKEVFDGMLGSLLLSSGWRNMY